MTHFHSNVLLQQTKEKDNDKRRDDNDRQREDNKDNRQKKKSR